MSHTSSLSTSSRLFVAGLDPVTTESTLRPVFDVFGTLKDIFVIHKNHPEKSFAFVEYHSVADCHRAMDSFSTTRCRVDGMRVDVKIAVSREEEQARRSQKSKRGRDSDSAHAPSTQTKRHAFASRESRGSYAPPAYDSSAYCHTVHSSHPFPVATTPHVPFAYSYGFSAPTSSASAPLYSSYPEPPRSIAWIPSYHPPSPTPLLTSTSGLDMMRALESLSSELYKHSSSSQTGVPVVEPVRVENVQPMHPYSGSASVEALSARDPPSSLSQTILAIQKWNESHSSVLSAMASSRTTDPPLGSTMHSDPSTYSPTQSGFTQHSSNLPLFSLSASSGFSCPS